jgi:predicted  nucleic acid-binding Zn-ribbon protein
MPREFSVVAIIAAYNEADIIGSVVSDLIDQGITIYFLDDGSTDGTVEAVEPYANRGVIKIERLRDAAAARSSEFSWERILRRKAQLASELDADWFIHHDADEFRESPWADVPLKEAIRRVDTMGYNAIDFASLDFRPTDDRFRGGDARPVFDFYSEGAPYDKVQIRCWKKTSGVDLASTGGHEARFENRNVFPIRFLLRHYPVRGQAHGDRKVFVDRQPRFAEPELARGWHVQYDDFVKGTSFIHDPCTLTRFDPAGVRIGLSLRHRGVEALEQSLEGARAEFDGVRAELETARSDIEARTTDIERLQGHVQLRSAENLALQQALEQREAEISDTRLQLDAVRTHLADRLSELARAQAQLNALDGELTDTRNQVTHKTNELASRRDEIAGLNNALAQRKVEVDNLQAAVADFLKQLDAFRHSLSWRVMTPARTALRLLRGR